MSYYKYIIFFFLFLICCEKNNYVTSSGELDVKLCDGTEFVNNTISVLSFNRLGGTSFNSVAKTLETLDPDIIGLQESYEIGIELADRFNYCFYGSTENSVAILSKYEIEAVNNLHYKIILNNNYYINFFNVHLPAYPYQPYDIRDTLITTELQAIHQAEQTRGIQTTELTTLITNINNDMPIIVVGDFNEPSHLDWVNGAENPFQFHLNNMSSNFTVNWPASNKMLNVGLTDAYRQIFSNPIEYPGYTWTPNYSVNEVHDRIDFIYYKNNLEINSIFVIGPDNISDIMISDYESDHRGVFGVFNVNSLHNNESPCEFCGSSICCLEVHTQNCCCYPN